MSLLLFSAFISSPLWVEKPLVGTQSNPLTTWLALPSQGRDKLVRMRFVVGIYRLLIAFFCLGGTYEAWLLGIGNKWVYFTFQTNIALGLVMLWAGAATLLKGIQPPAWLKGCLTLYIVITGLVAILVLGLNSTDYKLVLGIRTTWMIHVISPILASVDFLLFDPHRRFHWHNVLTWLIYFPFYVAFVLIRAAIWPHSGPEPGGNPYPYAFLDLGHLGWAQLMVNLAEYLVVFFALSLVIFLIDRILPAKTPLTIDR